MSNGNSTDWPTGKALDQLVLWAVAHEEENGEGVYPGGLAIVIDRKLGGDGMFIDAVRERAIWRAVERVRNAGLITSEGQRGYVIVRLGKEGQS